MKAQVRISPKMNVEIEGKTQKDVFKQIAEAQEVFANHKCGACQCEDVRFVVRTVDDNDFYELVCQNPKCRAKLAFGQTKKDDKLFPKRKDTEGKWIDNGGWAIWKKES